ASTDYLSHGPIIDVTSEPMSDAQMAPDPPIVAAHIKVGKDGRRITAAGLEVLRQNSQYGRQAMRDALAMRREALAQRHDPQDTDAESKAFALSLVPLILRRWGKGALG